MAGALEASARCVVQVANVESYHRGKAIDFFGRQHQWRVAGAQEMLEAHSAAVQISPLASGPFGGNLAFSHHASRLDQDWAAEGVGEHHKSSGDA